MTCNITSGLFNLRWEASSGAKREAEATSKLQSRSRYSSTACLAVIVAGLGSRLLSSSAAALVDENCSAVGVAA